MDRNPADLATRPRAARDDRDPPTPQDAVRLLAAAEAYRPDLALWLWLVLVTGTRRGELCAIRWTDIDVARQDLLIERAYAIRGGQKVIKATKTHQRRLVAVDPATVELLAGTGSCAASELEAAEPSRPTGTSSPATASASSRGRPIP